jgi:hypothetical protein
VTSQVEAQGAPTIELNPLRALKPREQPRQPQPRAAQRCSPPPAVSSGSGGVTATPPSVLTRRRRASPPTDAAAAAAAAAVGAGNRREYSSPEPEPEATPTAGLSLSHVSIGSVVDTASERCVSTAAPQC